MMIRARRII